MEAGALHEKVEKEFHVSTPDLYVVLWREYLIAHDMIGRSI